VRRLAGLAHDGDDLLHRGWIRRAAAAVVARRSAGVEAWQYCWRSTTAGGMQQHVGHDTLLTIGER